MSNEVDELQPDKELKIVIADDSGLIRDSLWRVFSATRGFRVVGMAADGDMAVKLVHELEPHVLVLDNSMPRKDGLEVLREVRSTVSAAIAIVIFTAAPSPTLRKICLDAGADYYLDKSQIVRLIDICSQQLLAL